MDTITLEAVLDQARQLSPDDQARLTASLRRERAKRLAGLLDEWAADESGYEEAAWPALRATLDRTRAELGMIGLFGDEPVNHP